MKIIFRLQEKVPSKNLVMAGGCAMNGLVNGRIFKESNFKNHFIQPASTDDGTALGAAYYCWHNFKSKGTICDETCFLGTFI